MEFPRWSPPPRESLKVQQLASLRRTALDHHIPDDKTHFAECAERHLVEWLDTRVVAPLRALYMSGMGLQTEGRKML